MSRMTVSPRCPEIVRTTYLRHPIDITDAHVTVYDPGGLRLARVASVKQARLFVRGYRRAEREGM